MEEQNPFLFDRPEAQLPPNLKELCRDLRTHGFCIFRDEMIEEMSYRVTQGQIKQGASRKGQMYEVGRKLAMFREACRMISIEKSQNLILQNVTGENGLSHLFIVLAPVNHPGSMPEEPYIEDKDGKGVHTKETVEKPGDTGPTMEIRTNSLR